MTVMQCREFECGVKQRRLPVAREKDECGRRGGGVGGLSGGRAGGSAFLYGG